MNDFVALEFDLEREGRRKMLKKSSLAILIVKPWRLRHCGNVIVESRRKR